MHRGTTPFFSWISPSSATVRGLLYPLFDTQVGRLLWLIGTVKNFTVVLYTFAPAPGRRPFLLFLSGWMSAIVGFDDVEGMN